MENWISVEPASGAGGEDPQTVEVTVQEAEDVSILNGKEPRKTILTVSDGSTSKQVTILQKGYLYRDLSFVARRGSNPLFTARASVLNFPEALQEQIYWCIDRLCWRFEGYTSDPSEVKDYIAPAGTVTFFLPPEDRDGKTKIIYHGDSSHLQVFGDTTQDIPLVIKYNNYVEFDFTELNENRTKKFRPITIIISDVEEGKDFYYSFGVDYGNGDGVIWGPRTRVNFRQL